jgi:hypothetical protein
LLSSSAGSAAVVDGSDWGGVLIVVVAGGVVVVGNRRILVVVSILWCNGGPLSPRHRKTQPENVSFFSLSVLMIRFRFSLFGQ